MTLEINLHKSDSGVPSVTKAREDRQGIQWPFSAPCRPQTFCVVAHWNSFLKSTQKNYNSSSLTAFCCTSISKTVWLLNPTGLS